MRKHTCSLLLLAGLLGLSPAVRAQSATAVAAGPAYQFMLFTTVEGPTSFFSFAPEFVGQRIVEQPKLYMNQVFSKKDQQGQLSNENVVMQKLEAISAAGWELVQVNSAPIQVDGLRTRYLFRKAK